MRKSGSFLLLIALLFGLFLISLLDTAGAVPEAEERLMHTRALVTALGLTDPALFTEARYTRHLSQADLHSAFQDHPMALEHFPSGSLILPPQVGSGE